MVTLGEMITMEEAFRSGVIDHLVPDEKTLHETAEDVAQPLDHPRTFEGSLLVQDALP